MDKNLLEKSFLSLYAKFRALNIHITKQYNSDRLMKKQLESISLIFEDLNEHYYWEEIKRRDEQDGKETESH